MDEDVAADEENELPVDEDESTVQEKPATEDTNRVKVCFSRQDSIYLKAVLAQSDFVTSYKYDAAAERLIN